MLHFSDSKTMAKALRKDLNDVTAVVLDRDRHADIIRECREAGVRIRLTFRHGHGPQQ